MSVAVFVGCSNDFPENQLTKVRATNNNLNWGLESTAQDLKSTETRRVKKIIGRVEPPNPTKSDAADVTANDTQQCFVRTKQQKELTSDCCD